MGPPSSRGLVGRYPAAPADERVPATALLRFHLLGGSVAVARDGLGLAAGDFRGHGRPGGRLLPAAFLAARVRGPVVSLGGSRRHLASSRRPRFALVLTRSGEAGTPTAPSVPRVLTG